MSKSTNNGNGKALTNDQIRAIEEQILDAEAQLEALKSKLPAGHRIGRVVENGVVHPAENTDCGTIWKVCDQLNNTKAGAVLGKVVDRCVKKGINETTARVQFYRWRKFNGIEGHQH